ncbi:MAG: bifunctional diaminohydroxyphosphoribosylaminopyrimidine deaminase/5-amino-6-(5-phosphoribosylamino)uracil reductase RibD, partial [Flavobacteriaceae bacterium]
MNENELKKHKKYMLRCIEIAKRNSSKHYPNPSVGALVLKNDIIISEGVTGDYGSNHAEVNAIKPLQNKTDLSNAILYVTLEPCSHHGKTPPCTELIYKSGIKNVIIGTLDISSKVNGKGISYLKTKGINVISGICEDKCNQLHKNFLHYNKHKRPYVILKWA